MIQTSLSHEQTEFCLMLSDIGCINLTCQRLGVDKLRLQDWIDDNKYFKTRLKKAKDFYRRNLEDELAVEGLKQLSSVLKHGEYKYSIATSEIESLDREGGIVTLKGKKETTTKSKAPAWAIRQAVMIAVRQQVEDNVVNALTQLIDQNLLPDAIKEQVMMILDTAESEVQDLLGKDLSKVTVTEELLSEIQHSLIAGS